MLSWGTGIWGLGEWGGLWDHWERKECATKNLFWRRGRSPFQFHSFWVWGILEYLGEIVHCDICVWSSQGRDTVNFVLIRVTTGCRGKRISLKYKTAMKTKLETGVCQFSVFQYPFNLVLNCRQSTEAELRYCTGTDWSAEEHSSMPEMDELGLQGKEMGLASKRRIRSEEVLCPNIKSTRAPQRQHVAQLLPSGSLVCLDRGQNVPR